MKIFYTRPSKFAEVDYIETYKKTVNYLSFKVGQKNVKFPLPKPKTSMDQDLAEAVKAVHLDERNIRECDALIAEATDGTAAIGFHVALALNEKKPILVLRKKGGSSKLAHGPFTSGAHKSISYREYETEEDITRFVDQFIEEARQKIDSKFILILPREIDKYLNWVADFRRMHKAQIVREAMEVQMKKDKDWKDYLKQENS